MRRYSSGPRLEKGTGRRIVGRERRRAGRRSKVKSNKKREDRGEGPLRIKKKERKTWG